MTKLKCLIIMILLFPLVVRGQKITLQLFSKTKCNDTIKALYPYFASRDSINYIAWENNLVELPDTGEYFIKTADAEGDLIRININNIGINVDTILISSILSIAYIPKYPNFSGWLCCDMKCEGYQVDYYNNGFKRVEGFFKKGKAIGELRYYKLDGSLSVIEYYSKRGKYLRKKHFP